MKIYIDLENVTVKQQRALAQLIKDYDRAENIDIEDAGEPGGAMLLWPHNLKDKYKLMDKQGVIS